MSFWLANKSRRLLITCGKVFPFSLCAVLTVAYLESIIALATNDYIEYDGYSVLNTPISFLIGGFFEYNLPVALFSLVISIAIEACRWNLFACAYLLFHLFEKYIFTFEMNCGMAACVILANLAVSGIFMIKGITIFLKSAK